MGPVSKRSEKETNRSPSTDAAEKAAAATQDADESFVSELEDGPELRKARQDFDEKLGWEEQVEEHRIPRVSEARTRPDQVCDDDWPSECCQDEPEDGIKVPSTESIHEAKHKHKEMNHCHRTKQQIQQRHCR